jgi:hypothetical protein
MKTFTENQFIEFCRSAEWVTAQDCEINEYEIPANTGDEEDGGKLRATAYCWKTAGFDGVTITYQDECSWDGTLGARFGGFEVEQSSDRTWKTEGLTLMDKYGDEMEWRDVVDLLSQVSDGGYLGEIKQIGHELLIPAIATQAADDAAAPVVQDDDMEDIELDNDNAPDISFRGKLIGAGSSQDSIRQKTRWTVYRIYRTAGGKLIGQIIGRTIWQGEVDRYTAKVCSSEQELVRFIGYSDAAKEAFSEAGIETAMKVK